MLRCNIVLILRRQERDELLVQNVWETFEPNKEAITTIVAPRSGLSLRQERYSQSSSSHYQDANARYLARKDNRLCMLR